MKLNAILRAAVIPCAVSLSLVLAGCQVSRQAGQGSDAQWGSATGPSSASGSSSTDQASDAVIPVVNDSHSDFDRLVKNAIADVQAFWRTTYPEVSGGKPYPELSGGIYSVDGTHLTAAVQRNACLRQDPSGASNNAFYCQADDSIVYDRNPQHLVAQLGAKYGDFMIAAVIAHEWGHAIQQRLGVFESSPNRATIYTETQADCASGAFIATAQKHRAPHFAITNQQLENTLLGYLQVRDPPPLSVQQISHGNGFDRLSAMADGISNGASFCYAEKFFSRSFTERPFTSDVDYEQRGNLPYAEMIDPTPTTPDGSSLQIQLNSFWSAAAQSIKKPWQSVSTRETDHPRCDSTNTTEFNYCPSGNYVYFSDQEARQAYNSLPDKQQNPQTGQLTLIDNAPADYSLGMLFVYGWAMAVRSQLFHASTQDRDAILAASCYSGAFTASINTDDPSQGFALSPPDMDEATAAVIRVVPEPQAYGAHGTTALDRIQSFTKGYFGGLPSC